MLVNPNYTNASKDDTWSIKTLFKDFPGQKFAKGEQVIKLNDKGNNILLIDSGKVITYSYDKSKKRKFANDYFVENQFINLELLDINYPRNNFAVSITNSVIKVIPLLVFYKKLNQIPTLQQWVTQVLLKKSQNYLLRWHRMANLSSQERIFYFLIEQVQEIGERIGYEWLIRNKLSMSQIGELTQTSRQTASTQLNRLKKEGIIHFRGRKYLIIRDLDRLKEIANYS